MGNNNPWHQQEDHGAHSQATQTCMLVGLLCALAAAQFRLAPSTSCFGCQKAFSRFAGMLACFVFHRGVVAAKGSTPNTVPRRNWSLCQNVHSVGIGCDILKALVLHHGSCAWRQLNIIRSNMPLSHCGVPDSTGMRDCAAVCMSILVRGWCSCRVANACRPYLVLGSLLCSDRTDVMFLGLEGRSCL
jgi:hypothetical protein